MNELQLLNQLLSQTTNLTLLNTTKLDELRRRAEMIIRNIFGETSKYLVDLNRLYFYPHFSPASEDYKSKCWERGKAEFINLLNTMIEEKKLFGSSQRKELVLKQKKESKSRRIFVVHGHDEEMKMSVARTLEKLDIEPIILHEKPNKSRTLIEKFTDYSDVVFAVILLSPDDVGYAKNEDPPNPKFRARQNVILELGFFLGRLGRERVIVLFKKDEKFEMPTDYSGVLFTPYDSSGNWKFDLVKELKACNISIDANKIL